MMNRIFSTLILFSVLCAMLTGNMPALSASILEAGVDAVELTFYLMGGMCVWGGLLHVAEAAGITKLLAHGFSGFAKHLFHGIALDGKALPAITMNFAANLLGLGNAATPFGLAAIKALKEEAHCGDTASDNMVLFTVLNTASITIIPSTVAALRLRHGSAEPLVILPAVLLSSGITLCVLIVVTKVSATVWRKK